MIKKEAFKKRTIEERWSEEKGREKEKEKEKKRKKKKENRERMKEDSGVKDDLKRICVENEKCIETLSSSFTSVLHYQSIFSSTPAWGQGTTFKRRNIFFSFFFFYSVKTVALRWKKMGPREMRKHRKPPEKSLTVRFNHATQRAFNYGKSR